MSKKSDSKKSTSKTSKKGLKSSKDTEIRKQKRISIIKDLLPSIILSLVTAFMLFIFEPITMYATNPNDFWFDIYDIFPTLFVTFLLSSLGLFAIYTIIYVICKLLIKKISIYYIVIAIAFCIFVITYIQGNFLSGNLPGINGQPFNWRLHGEESVISVILWFVCFGILLILLTKIKPTKIFSFIAPITLAIFLMLSTSLVSTAITKDVLKNKETSAATIKNINLASTKQNVFIFLTDAVDAKTFHQQLKNNSDYQEIFKDFTFFNDTLSFYPYTRDSIPYIFSPIPNHNETSFQDFSNDVLSKSEIFKQLEEDNYNMNFFDPHNYMDEETSSNFQNTFTKIPLATNKFIEQVVKYDLYKYLPYPLKGKAHVENLDFASTKEALDYDIFNWKNTFAYNILTTEPIETTDEKVFHFFYVEGSHIPFNLDENLNTIDPTIGSYKKKLSATFKVIKAYIDRLKKAGVYDNSAIMIMADHGYYDQGWEYDYVLDRFNPILYIKGVDEHHDKMQTSGKPIAFEDLSEAINELRQNKKSTELFSNINYPRKRTLMYYVWSKENHMVEYETEGKAWESNKMKETGNIYDLEQ